MNRSPLPKILLAILALIAIASLYECWSFTQQAKEIRNAQAMTNMMNARQQLFAQLVQDCAEFAKHSPAMDQLLRSVNTASQPTASATPAPASKPAGK